MFKQILATIIWLLASFWMQGTCQPSSMQELYQIIYNLQKVCQYKTGIDLAIAKSLLTHIGIKSAYAQTIPNKTGTEIAIAWNIPKVIGTGFADAEGMPNKIGTVYANTIFMPNLN